MHSSLSPIALRNTFELEPEAEDSAVHILDLTEVPYMDSAGLGMIVSHYVRCQGKGIRLFAAGVSPRVLQLLEMTKTEDLFPRVASVEEIDPA
jgi:anti-anti-sigma factor